MKFIFYNIVQPNPIAPSPKCVEITGLIASISIEIVYVLNMNNLKNVYLLLMNTYIIFIY